MKKFLLFNICLTIIFLLVNLLTLSFIEDKIVERFTAPFFVYEMGEERYNVVNLGTSHGEVGFDWKSVNHAGLNGLNFGLSSKPFSYDYFIWSGDQFTHYKLHQLVCRNFDSYIENVVKLVKLSKHPYLCSHYKN